ncbi:uncharacterized protein LOC105775551 [Gossypium raimondii]|uniref:uncharacterized protein LOC105775551 n=1 Tax=Gossypium raimondii TaxID=29730 RepID=UPI00063AD0C6|nr:uncharacterized protein LOC105775551 [Gossypium raimondii]
MPNSVKFLEELLTNKWKLDDSSHVELNAVCSAIMQNKLPYKLKDPETLQKNINELNEWRTHVKEKLRIHNAEPKRRYDEHMDGTNQFKVGDKVLLDKIDPRIATSELDTNGSNPFTVLNVFPYGKVEIHHGEHSQQVQGRRLRFEKVEDTWRDLLLEHHQARHPYL